MLISLSISTPASYVPAGLYFPSATHPLLPVGFAEDRRCTESHTRCLVNSMVLEMAAVVIIVILITEN